MSDLTHVDEQGRVRMVDVSHKADTRRGAIASARLRTRPDVIARIGERAIVKGDVLATARVAGIMAAKRTADVIPLCHPLPITAAEVDLRLAGDTIEIRAEVSTTGKTGVEMEALTAASIAALTVYDMCKAIDRAMVIERVQLEEKRGGKSGVFLREEIE